MLSPGHQYWRGDGRSSDIVITFKTLSPTMIYWGNKSKY